MSPSTKRREFITLLGGAAAWPLAARAQQTERVRRLAVLMYPARDDPEGQARIAAFLDSLEQLGWTDGRNVRIDIRWPAGFGADRVRQDASELVAAAPDVILATGNIATAPLQQLTRTVPIVFVVTADPVSNGYVASRDQIERAVSEFARGSNGGLIVTAGGVVVVHRKLFIALAARHRLPTVYWNRMYVADGGLISYGPDTIDQYRRAAAYVDRILKGEKPADLPVQAPTRYDLAINLKTARALGLEVPPTLLAIANEVIE